MSRYRPTVDNLSERVEMVLADVCRRAGGIYGDPSPKEFAAILEKHGLEIRDAAKPVESMP
jgi:hypothetical protein